MRRLSNERSPGHSEADCPSALQAVQDALYVLHGKWKIPVIVTLSEGKMRFGDVKKALKGISAKVLSQQLKELEINGFVVRHDDGPNPASIEYELTEYSDTLDQVVSALKEWGMLHRQHIRGQTKIK